MSLNIDDVREALSEKKTWVSRVVFNNRKLTFDWELRGHLTIIRGNSGTGKTYGFGVLQQISAANRYDMFYPREVLDRIIVISAGTMPADQFFNIIRGLSGKLIFVDNGDRVLTKALVEYIRLDLSNQYVICCRGLHDWYADLNCFAELKKVGSKIVTWFKMDKLRGIR